MIAWCLRWNQHTKWIPNMNFDQTDIRLTIQPADDVALHQCFQNNLQELEFLDLYATEDGSYTELDPASFRPLFSGNLYPKLSYLGLHFTSNTDELVEYLVQSKFWGRLDVLDLSCNELSDYGVRYLLKSKKTSWLRKLDLHDNRLTQRYFAKLAELPCETDLRQRSDMTEDDDDDRYDSIWE